MFSIFSTAQKSPKIFTEFFGKCKIFTKKYEKKITEKSSISYMYKLDETSNFRFQVRRFFFRVRLHPTDVGVDNWVPNLP